MSKSEILGELPKLAQGDRQEILDRLWEIEESELLKGAQPDADEKAILDAELQDYQSKAHAGSDWKDVETRLRRMIRP